MRQQSLTDWRVALQGNRCGKFNEEKLDWTSLGRELGLKEGIKGEEEKVKLNLFNYTKMEIAFGKSICG